MIFAQALIRMGLTHSPLFICEFVITIFRDEIHGYTGPVYRPEDMLYSPTMFKGELKTVTFRLTLDP